MTIDNGSRDIAELVKTETDTAPEVTSGQAVPTPFRFGADGMWLIARTNHIGPATPEEVRMHKRIRELEAANRQVGRIAARLGAMYEHRGAQIDHLATECEALHRLIERDLLDEVER